MQNNTNWKLCTISDLMHHANFNGFGNVYNDMRLNLKEFINTTHKPVDFFYNKENKLWDIDLTKQDMDSTAVYNFAKTHWLVNDIAVNGCSFLPQLNINDWHITAHPGTYRFYALVYNNMLTGDILIYDYDNLLNTVPALTQEELHKHVESGFMRYREVEQLQKKQEKAGYTGYHEVDKTINYIIKENFYELRKLYSTFTIYICHDAPPQIMHDIKHTYNVTIKRLPVVKDSIFYIPYLEKFKGVSVFLNYKITRDVNNNFDFNMLYSLDTIDDVCYTKDMQIIIFNNASSGCKRLIPSIIQQSKSSYLKQLKWCKKKKVIDYNEI